MAKVEYVRCVCGEFILAPATGKWTEAFPAFLTFLETHRAHCRPDEDCFRVEFGEGPD